MVSLDLSRKTLGYTVYSLLLSLVHILLQSIASQRQTQANPQHTLVHTKKYAGILTFRAQSRLTQCRWRSCAVLH